MEMNDEVFVESVIPVYAHVRRVAEWLAAGVLLVAALPLLLIAAGLVRLTSRGPAFYSQVRLGKDGRPFRIYKIRTMAHNCEAVTGPVWARADDPRATAVGRVLRRTHLDELPQLWNVLRGEMSLVGPRPERPEIVAGLERSLPGYRTRLRVRPGLTGLAQLLLPADSDLESARRKLEVDLAYVRSAGPLLDLRILLATPLHLLAEMLGVAAKGLARWGTEGRTTADSETDNQRKGCHMLPSGQSDSEPASRERKAA